jgi:hypothetical protein
MKTLRLYGAGLLVALLLALAACNTSGGGSGGSGGGGGGGGPSTTVTVKQSGNGSSLVYYRVGSGNWQFLTLSGGQGTFTATGDYEVAARCDDGNILYLFKASPSYQNQAIFACGDVSISVRNVEFAVTLPSSVGGVNPQNGDWVYVGLSSETYTGTNPVMVNAKNLKTGAGSVAITLHRLTPSPSGVSTTPYGYKVVSLGANDTRVTVDASGWQTFTSTRALSVSTPVFFYQGTAEVLHFRDSYLTPTLVGLAAPFSGSSVAGRYGLLPSGGVYVGLYFATKMEGLIVTDTLIMYRDTGGNDWNATPPAPWASGQFSVRGDTLTFSRTDARAFTAELSGLAQRTGGTPLGLNIFVQAAPGGSTTYRIPVVPGLDYTLLSNPTEVNFSLVAWDRGADLRADLFGGPFFATEAQLRGIDLAVAVKNGRYSGRDYTLP